jgi:chromate transporter
MRSSNAATDMSGIGSAEQERPRSCFELFTAFSILALQGFGGTLAIVQRELVERRRWLTPEEFVEDLALAQVLPGPTVINMAVMIGAKHFGTRGAMSALAGMVTIPLLILLVAAFVHAHYAQHPVMMGALRGMNAVAAGLIAAAGVKLFSALHANVLGMRVCLLIALLGFGAIALLHVSLYLVLLSLGLAGGIGAYRKLSA